MRISEDERSKNDTLNLELIKILLSYSKADGHNFTNGSQNIEASTIIKLVHSHLKKGAYSYLDKK